MAFKIPIHYFLLLFSLICFVSSILFIYKSNLKYLNRSVNLFLSLQIFLIFSLIIRWQNLFTYGSSIFILFYIFFLRVFLKHIYPQIKLFKSKSVLAVKVSFLNSYIDFMIVSFFFYNKLIFWLYKVGCYFIETWFRRFLQNPEKSAKYLYGSFFIIFIITFFIEYFFYDKILFTVLFLSIFFLSQRILLTLLKLLRFYLEATLLEITNHPAFYHWFHSSKNPDRIIHFYQKIGNLNNVLFEDDNHEPKYLAKKYEAFSKVTNYNKSYYCVYALERYFIPYYRNWFNLTAFTFFGGFFLIHVCEKTSLSFFSFHIFFMAFALIILVFDTYYQKENLRVLFFLLEQQTILTTEMREGYKFRVLQFIGKEYEHLFQEHSEILNFKNYGKDKPKTLKECFEKLYDEKLLDVA